MLLNLSTWNSNSLKQSILAKRVQTPMHSVNVKAIKIQMTSFEILSFAKKLASLFHIIVKALFLVVLSI